MKTCPFKAHAMLLARWGNSAVFAREILDEETRCSGHGCQLWTSAYTIEHIEIWGCAHVINARKNAEGLVVV